MIDYRLDENGNLVPYMDSTTNPFVPQVTPQQKFTPKQYSGRGEMGMPMPAQPKSGLLDNASTPSPAPAGEESFMDKLMSARGIGAISNAYLAASQDPALQRMGIAGLDRMRQESSAGKKRNATVEALRKAGQEKLAQAVESGMLPAAEAAQILFSQPKDDRTALQSNFEYAKAQGYTGSFEQFMKDKGAGVNVNVGGEGTSELDKTLQKATGTRFNSYLQAGDSAAALIPELRTLEQLANAAPSGPLQGRLAEMFPEANDASAAFMSMIQRLAPTMRVEGSGSTSDTEFNAMLRSLGSLRNSPEANSMIYDAFRRKAVLDQARAETVRMYQSKQLTLDEAQQKLGKLNAERILSDDLRTMVDPDNNMSVEIPAQAPETLPAGVRDLWPNMTDAQKRKFL